ncbi:PaREP1 family protein [Chloroflexota bacterium]
MDAEAKVKKYAGQSRHYLLDASKFIDSGDSEKASEFLWGSMAQALKAVAASNDIHLGNHRRIWDYAESLTKELEDKSIYDAFIQANYLHTNFYESELELKNVRRIAEDIRIAIGRLLSLVPEESEET